MTYYMFSIKSQIVERFALLHDPLDLDPDPRPHLAGGLPYGKPLRVLCSGALRYSLSRLSDSEFEPLLE